MEVVRQLRRLREDQLRHGINIIATMWAPLHVEAVQRVAADELLLIVAHDGAVKRTIDHARLAQQLKCLSQTQRAELVAQLRALPRRRCGCGCAQRPRAQARSVSTAATPSVADLVG